VHACVFKHNSCIWKFKAHENVIIHSCVLWTVFLLMWYHKLYHCSVVMLVMYLYTYLWSIFKVFLQVLLILGSYRMLLKERCYDAVLLWSVVAGRQNAVTEFSRILSLC